MILRYTDSSKDDIDMAFAWYEKQRRGLGFEFPDSVEMSLMNIPAFPEMYKYMLLQFQKVCYQKISLLNFLHYRARRNCNSFCF